ncbi:MAG TPA: DUF4215 domain-containing protein [Polyangiaceae bacterium]|nr:DUF4215 domain-containing protein [Polyangiaceae bacterium]
MRRPLLVAAVLAAACSARSELDAPIGGASSGGGGTGAAGTGGGSVTIGEGGGAATVVTVGEGGGAITVGPGGAPPTFCGDGVIDPGEECDDGNTRSGDGCSSSCTVEVFDVCGDGVVGATEQCDLGASNEDRPALAWRQGSGAWSPMRPRESSGSAVGFYDYFSASPHTGLEALLTSRAYLYRNTLNGVMSLVVHHGIDQSTTGQAQPSSVVDMHLDGLPPGSFLALSDEMDETSTSGSTADANWQFQNNGDGAVFAGLPIPGDWTITITADFVQGIDTWTVLADAAALPGSPLDMTLPLEIRATSTPSACRTDCTLPTCGDGFLDAGEACDDGNTTSGDGCRSDCASTH